MNATPPSYNERELLYDLATGMSYDDFRGLYGMSPLQADTVVRSLQHSYDIERDLEEGVWRLKDADEVLEGL